MAEKQEGSHVHPMQCSALRKGGFVMLKDHPCKIVEISFSKTGKHGHAKGHIVGIDIFTGKKYEDLCPSTHNMECPNVTKSEYQLLDISDDGMLSLMSDDGKTRDDVRLGESEEAEKLKEDFAEGKELIVSVTTAMGDSCFSGYKEDTKK